MKPVNKWAKFLILFCYAPDSSLSTEIFHRTRRLAYVIVELSLFLFYHFSVTYIKDWKCRSAAARSTVKAEKNLSQLQVAGRSTAIPASVPGVLLYFT